MGMAALMYMQSIRVRPWCPIRGPELSAQHCCLVLRVSRKCSHPPCKPASITSAVNSRSTHVERIEVPRGGLHDARNDHKVKGELRQDTEGVI